MFFKKPLKGLFTSQKRPFVNIPLFFVRCYNRKPIMIWQSQHQFQRMIAGRDKSFTETPKA